MENEALEIVIIDEWDNHIGDHNIF